MFKFWSQISLKSDHLNSGPNLGPIELKFVAGVKGIETCQKVPPNPNTARVLKLQCANFAKRVLN